MSVYFYRRYIRLKISPGLSYVTDREEVQTKDGKGKKEYKEGLGSLRMLYRLEVFPSVLVPECLANPRFYL
jgi:hypothetical protein